MNDLVMARAPWPLLLLGPAGTGKTRAALCLLDASGGEYWTVADLCRELIRLDKEEVYYPGATGSRRYAQHLWDEIRGANLLVLDEIGAREKVTDFHYETVKRAIDIREERPFVAISNLDLPQLSRLYDDRIASRLAGGTVANLKGADRRLVKQES